MKCADVDVSPPALWGDPDFGVVAGLLLADCVGDGKGGLHAKWGRARLADVGLLSGEFEVVGWCGRCWAGYGGLGFDAGRKEEQ